MGITPIVVSVGTTPVNLLADLVRASASDSDTVRIDAPASGTAHIVSDAIPGSDPGYPIPSGGLEIPLPETGEIWVVASTATTVEALVSGMRFRDLDPNYDKPPAILSELEVAFDYTRGLVNRGSDRDAVLAVSGGSNALDRNADRTFNVPDDTSGIVVSNYGGDRSLNAAGDAIDLTADCIFAYVVVDLGSVSGNSGVGRLFGFRTGTSDTEEGPEIRSSFVGGFKPVSIIGDGTNSVVTAGTIPDIDTGARTMVVLDTYSFVGVNGLRLRVVTSAGVSFTATATIATFVAASVAAGANMVFFSGASAGGEPTGGLNGTRDLAGIAGGFHHGRQITDAEVTAIARYYGVMTG